MASKLDTFVSSVMTMAANIKAKFNTITSAIGDLANLNTTDKTSLVNALNEVDADLSNYIPLTQKGTANGVAATGADNKILAVHLPGYVDDIIEGEYINTTTFNNTLGNPVSLETGKIYVDITTGKTYRYTSTILVLLSESLALGETAGSAYRGDRGKAAYDHSLITSGNPHNVTKAEVGLSNVQNYGIATQAENEGGTVNTKYTTPLGIEQYVNVKVGDNDPNNEFITGLM